MDAITIECNEDSTTYSIGHVYSAWRSIMPTANGVFEKVYLPYVLVAYPIGNDRVRVYGCICVSMSKKIYEGFHEDPMYYFIMFHILCYSHGYFHEHLSSI